MFAQFIESDGRWAFRPERRSADDIEISDADHAALFAEIAAEHSGPKIISRDTDGRPAIQDLPPPADEQLANVARARRDMLLTDTEWIVWRHRDEIDTGRDTTLSAADYVTLLNYRQALRDVPLQPGFPHHIDWPQ